MSLKVLLADDDKMAVFLQKIIIAESNFTTDIEAFSTGLETLQYIDANYNPEDEYFIFLDINMPVMNGWEFLAELDQRPYADKVFIAMVSSYSQLTDKEACKKHKQIVYIFEKPITVEACREIMHLPQLSKYFNPIA